MAAGCCINYKVTVDDERSTDGSENDDYKPNFAEHPATTSDDKGGDTKKLNITMHLPTQVQLWMGMIFLIWNIMNYLLISHLIKEILMI